MNNPTEFAPGLVIQGFTPPLSLRDFKLIAFDMDSTLINIECVDEIADAAGRKPEVAAITEAAMRVEIADYKESQLAAGHPGGPLGHYRQPPPGQQSPRADCQPSQQRVDQRRQPLGITIKHSLGRGDMPIAGAKTKAWLKESGCRLLNIEATHMLGVAALPLHHNNPFDGLLVAQALAEPLRLITHNAQVARYSDTIIAI